MDSEEIYCFMTATEIYNKVKLHINIIPFGRFPLENKKNSIFFRL